MTDEQKALVRAVATEVMGWTLAGEDEDVYTDGYGGWFELDFGQDIDFNESDPFSPLTLYDSAGIVIREMELKEWEWEKRGVQFLFKKGRRVFSSEHGRWRQAMCEAALEAVRSEKR